MDNNEKDKMFSTYAIILTVAIIVGTAYFVINRQSASSSQGNPSPSDTATPAIAPAQSPTTPVAAPAVDISQVKTVNEPFIGSANAPVTMAVWSDYQCPYCKKLEDGALPSVVADYVKTGKVKIIYKDFPFLGADSQTAALVARAVWEAAPAKFGDWHDAMFAKQGAENSGWATQANIFALTKTISGINEAKVEQLLAANSAKYQQAIDADKAEAAAFGINGTPSFIIGKQLSVGALPYASVKTLIDGVLSSK